LAIAATVLIPIAWSDPAWLAALDGAGHDTEFGLQGTGIPPTSATCTTS
jgi:hypothetical protein